MHRPYFSARTGIGLVAVMVLGQAACFNPRAGGGFTCDDAAPQCPSGQVCKAGACVPKDAIFDRGTPLDLGGSDFDPKSCKPDPDHFITIPEGSFMMGTPESGNRCGETDEILHKVTLTHSFKMQATEVTNRQYIKLMGYTPAWYYAQCGDDCPVEQVTWHGAAAYCNALSRKEGREPCYEDKGSGLACTYVFNQRTCAGSHEACAGVARTSGTCLGYAPVAKYAGAKIYDCPGYRLPTEAEWEYAYRAGTTSDLYNGPLKNCELEQDPNASAIGWYKYNPRMKRHDSGLRDIYPHRVATLRPNNWCLYDLAGNVWEWNNDWYITGGLGSSPVVDPAGAASGSVKGTRGGSFYDDPKWLRGAERLGWPHWVTVSRKGFRCVRSVLPGDRDAGI